MRILGTATSLLPESAEDKRTLQPYAQVDQAGAVAAATPQRVA